jgi:hypothetical protein
MKVKREFIYKRGTRAERVITAVATAGAKKYSYFYVTCSFAIKLPGDTKKTIEVDGQEMDYGEFICEQRNRSSKNSKLTFSASFYSSYRNKTFLSGVIEGFYRNYVVHNILDKLSDNEDILYPEVGKKLN